jgi:tRNA (cmo5U34)-methyltransferase
MNTTNEITGAGDSITTRNAGWSFAGAQVSENFDGHVKKSVPFYEEGHQLVSRLSDFFLTKDSLGYELGCSTGTLLMELAAHNEHKNARFIGLDEQPAMIDKARTKCSEFKSISLECADILDYDFAQSDLIVLYYTFQFVKPKFRQELMDKIYQSLNWGGAVILFEKVRAPDARFQDMMTSLYTDYKLEQGYTPAEIVSKSRSLKGVLEPFSSQENLNFLSRAGFKEVMSVYKCLWVDGFLASKYSCA